MLFMLQINNEGDENQDSGSCHVENQSINHEIHNKIQLYTNVIIVQNFILNQEISRGTSRQSI